MDYQKLMNEVRIREAEMAAMRESGHTLQQIGVKYGITAERVQQILQRLSDARGVSG